MYLIFWLLLANTSQAFQGAPQACPRGPIVPGPQEIFLLLKNANQTTSGSSEACYKALQLIRFL